jgi:ribulose-phosphate 3-epimerase
MKILLEYLAPHVRAKAGMLLYRYRFLIVYTLIGVASLLLEIILFRYLADQVKAPPPSAYLTAFLAGIVFAYWFNVRFNFKIPIAKRNRAIRYFVIISFGSGSLNYVLRSYLNAHGWTFEESRLVGSAVLFALAYWMHRKFSFVDFKKVGVAIYANGVEDIKSIWNRIGDYPDIIHVDIVDGSFSMAALDMKPYKLEVIQAFWPKKPIHVHLMTRNPRQMLNSVIPYSSTVIVHYEIDDDLTAVLETIRHGGRRVGVCLMIDTPLELIRPFMGYVDLLMLLSIKTPGQSGQNFELSTLDRIDELNQWSSRKSVEICVDGGVNEKIVHLLNVEVVVSGASVLNHADPKRQIMRLQTSNNYEAS